MNSKDVIARLKNGGWVTKESPHNVSKQGDVTIYNMLRLAEADLPELHIQLRFTAENELIAIEFSIRNSDIRIEDILKIQERRDVFNLLP